MKINGKFTTTIKKLNIKEMGKSYYSKRRLKKMGITINDKLAEIIINISSKEASAVRSHKIIKVIKKLNKPVITMVDNNITSLIF